MPGTQQFDFPPIVSDAEDVTEDHLQEITDAQNNDYTKASFNRDHICDCCKFDKGWVATNGRADTRLKTCYSFRVHYCEHCHRYATKEHNWKPAEDILKKIIMLKAQRDPKRGALLQSTRQMSQTQVSEAPSDHGRVASFGGHSSQLASSRNNTLVASATGILVYLRQDADCSEARRKCLNEVIDLLGRLPAR